MGNQTNHRGNMLFVLLIQTLVMSRTKSDFVLWSMAKYAVFLY